MAVRRVFTDRSHGDLRVGQDPDVLAQRRAAVVDLPWVWLRQVHGAGVVTVRRPDAAHLASVAGTEADAAVTDQPGVVLAVHTADCVPVLLTSPEGVIGAAHAGWKGIQAGVLGATVESMRALGASEIHVELGPAIAAECYEFGAADLDRLAATLGAGIRGRTGDGGPALDLRAAVRAALERPAGAPVGDDSESGPALASFTDAPRDEAGPTCTACALDEGGGPRWFSHRARGDVGRQASLIWIEP